MRKTLRIARREYGAQVRTKGFVIGLILAPVIMSGSLIALAIFKDSVDTSDQVIAVMDHSGIVAEALIEATDARNEAAVYNEDGEKVRPAYVIEIVEPDTVNANMQKLGLSNRVRDGSLHAFVEIGPDVLHPGEDIETYRVTYHSENSAMDDTRGWIQHPLNNHLRTRRMAESGIDESEVGNILWWVNVEPMGLVSVDEDTGEVRSARRTSEGEAIGAPIALVFLMFMLTMMGAVPLLQAVMEEKSQRIAEVLLGSVTPSQFMAGKVIGGVAVSLTAATVYVVIGVNAMNRAGLADFVPYDVIPWFFAFLILNITMLGSMMAALGSACNDAKEAQSATMPALMPLMIPMFTLMPIAMEPNGAFATFLSLIPIFTPTVMPMRIATPATIPAWQPWVGLAGVILITLIAIWAGGRLFRVAILMQGKPFKVGDVVRWAFRG
jgi:ABC-2 type transport system permease protein